MSAIGIDDNRAPAFQSLHLYALPAFGSFWCPQVATPNRIARHSNNEDSILSIWLMSIVPEYPENGRRPARRRARLFLRAGLNVMGESLAIGFLPFSVSETSRIPFASV